MERHNEQLAKHAGALHWYDFICPFCYIAQHRNAIIRKHGLGLTELPFQPHPDIPAGGIPAGPRSGAMYTMLEHEAQKAELPLRWPARLPNTRQALAAAEWTRRYQYQEFPALQRGLFAAHFALQEDIGDVAVIRRHADAAGVDVAAMSSALADGSALAFVAEGEAAGRRHGVHGTPAWVLNKQLISGLLPAEEFERLATQSEIDVLRAALREGWPIGQRENP